VAFRLSTPSGYGFNWAAWSIRETPNDMAVPNWRLHPLKGRLADHWAVWVDSHWRLTFTFDNGDVVLVDYRQYH